MQFRRRLLLLVVMFRVMLCTISHPPLTSYLLAQSMNKSIWHKASQAQVTYRTHKLFWCQQCFARRRRLNVGLANVIDVCKKVVCCKVSAINHKLNVLASAIILGYVRQATVSILMKDNKEQMSASANFFLSFSLSLSSVDCRAYILLCGNRKIKKQIYQRREILSSDVSAILEIVSYLINQECNSLSLS